MSKRDQADPAGPRSGIRRHGEKPGSELVKRQVSLPARAAADRDAEHAFARHLHGSVAAGFIYRDQAAQFLKAGLIHETAIDYAQDFLARLAPADPIEELLAAEAMWTHARLGHLTSMAGAETNIERLRVLHELCDRASNTLRRLALALAEYRRPRRPGTSGDAFIAIRQANVAAQQIVQNGRTEGENASNEQGWWPQPQRPSLQAQREGTGVSTAGGKAVPPLVKKHRTANPRGKGQVQPQCPPARRPLEESDRAATQARNASARASPVKTRRAGRTNA